MKIKINKINDFDKVIKILIKKINQNSFTDATVVSLSGDLGSGKTTFTKKFAEYLKIKGEVISPTFVISKKYKIPKNEYIKQNTLIHIDAYRLKNEKDLSFIGFSEQIKNNKNIIFIEWANLVKNGLPKKCIEIKFKYLAKNSRKVEI